MPLVIRSVRDLTTPTISSVLACDTGTPTTNSLSWSSSLMSSKTSTTSGCLAARNDKWWQRVSATSNFQHGDMTKPGNTQQQCRLEPDVTVTSPKAAVEHRSVQYQGFWDQMATPVNTLFCQYIPIIVSVCFLCEVNRSTRRLCSARILTFCPRYHTWTVCQVGLITCKNVCNHRMR